MSKLDGLRAMREARYEQAAARAKKSPEPPKATPRPRAGRAAVGAEEPAMGDPPPAETPLCGHRSMNGRSCTREQGHAAKSHRYS